MCSIKKKKTSSNTLKVSAQRQHWKCWNTVHTPHGCPPSLFKALHGFLRPSSSWMWFCLDIPRPTFVYLPWIPLGPSSAKDKWLMINSWLSMQIVGDLEQCVFASHWASSSSVLWPRPLPLTRPILLRLLIQRKGHPLYCSLSPFNRVPDGLGYCLGMAVIVGEVCVFLFPFQPQIPW